jgi:hypothetical protein
LGGSGVPETYTPSLFFTAMAGLGHTPAPGPMNAAAIDRDARLVLDKSTSLLGYQHYLAQARSWKAEGAALAPGFERELQVQAASAVVDTQTLALAALRIASQFKQAGQFDSMLSGWIAAIEKSGPINSAALLPDLENETSFRQNLKDEGVTDDIWKSLIANLKNIDATLSVQNGKLTVVPNQDKSRILAFAPSPTGMPQTLSALLRRGEFERMTATFQRTGGTGLFLLPGPDRDRELAEVFLSGAILSVQSIAAHSRGLQDTGLAKYAGAGPIVIGAIIAVVVSAIAGWYFSNSCQQDKTTGPCIAAAIFAILGFAGLAVLIQNSNLSQIPPMPSTAGCSQLSYNFRLGVWICTP